jgi:hypothetical protein
MDRREHLYAARSSSAGSSALSRALEEDEYVLPARFDGTELPGLGPAIGYIDLAEFAPATLVDLLAEKLGEPQGTPR